MTTAEIYEKKYTELMLRIKENLGDLKIILKEVKGHWHYEDYIYRFYHRSFKVQGIKSDTKRILEALMKLQDSKDGMDAQYTTIVKEGLVDIETDINDEWDKARKWVEAFLHSKYFLEMVVKYGEEYDAVPQMLDSGFAAVLELYNIR
jgi:hypothetical protein